MTVETLTPAQATDAVSVLCEAFHDYPVMRFVLGPPDDAYDRRLETLVGLFVSARFLRNEPVLAVRDDSGTVAGVAIVTLPGDRPPPDVFLARKTAVWGELGDAARQRYEAFGEAGRRFTVESPHHHLNMIGVRQSQTGRGLGRHLLESVHALAWNDPASTGISLSTEVAGNVPLYQHFGYRLLGHLRVSEELETWGFFWEKERTG